MRQPDNYAVDTSIGTCKQDGLGTLITRRRLFGWHLASALLRNLHAVVRYTQERVEGPDMARRHSHQHHTKNNHHAKRE